MSQLAIYNHRTKTTTRAGMEEWLDANAHWVDDEEERAILAGDTVALGFGPEPLLTVERVS